MHLSWGWKSLLGSALCSSLLASGAMAAEQADTATARAVYQQVQALQKAKALKQQSLQIDADGQQAECGCAPYGLQSSCTLARDRAGVVRLFTREGGGEDSAIQEAYYYDDAGRLRFAYVHLGAVNGTEEERRLYFSPQGQRVRELRRRLRGPGYTFPVPWPQHYEVPGHIQGKALALPLVPTAGTCPGD